MGREERGNSNLHVLKTVIPDMEKGLERELWFLGNTVVEIK